MKNWLIYDPYLASEGSNVVADFDTKEEAEVALLEGNAQNPDAYCGCYMIPLSELGNRV